jgi:hypothetical protein
MQMARRRASGPAGRFDRRFALGFNWNRSEATPMTRKPAFDLAATILLILPAGACGDGTPNGPSPPAVATIGVADETFRVALTSPEQVAAARGAQGGGSASIPNGRIVPGTQVNTGWSWHLEDVEFAQFTIELCDGRPSDVERDGVAFGGGRFCPWSATVLRVDEN